MNLCLLVIAYTLPVLFAQNINIRYQLINKKASYMLFIIYVCRSINKKE
jgi:hypothetical protein